MPLFPPARERFAEGQPPVRVPELAGIIGCSPGWLYKVIRAGAVQFGRVGSDYRIPVQEARRLAREAGVLRE